MSKISVDSLRSSLKKITDIGLDKQQTIKYIQNLGLDYLKESEETRECKYEGTLDFINLEETLYFKHIFTVKLTGSSDTGVSSIAVIDDYRGTTFEETINLMDPEKEINKNLAKSIYLMGYFEGMSKRINTRE